MNLKTLKNNFRYVLEKMIKRVQKNPQIVLKPDKEFEGTINLFRVYKDALTKRKLCTFCFAKMKLRDLSHEQKVTLYTSGLCPKCDEVDDNKSIFSLVKKNINN